MTKLTVLYKIQKIQKSIGVATKVKFTSKIPQSTIAKLANTPVAQRREIGQLSQKTYVVEKKFHQKQF